MRRSCEDEVQQKNNNEDFPMYLSNDELSASKHSTYKTKQKNKEETCSLKERIPCYQCQS